MFYVIALAGAHKRVINQLREQLAMVSSHKNTFRDHVISFIFILINLICSPFYSFYSLSLLKEGRDKRFLIQKLCQAQRPSAIKSAGSNVRHRSSSSSSSYHTSFSNNFDEAVFLAHSPPDSSTHVWGKDLTLQTRCTTGQKCTVFEKQLFFIILKTLHFTSFCGPIGNGLFCLFSVLLTNIKLCRNFCKYF